MVFLFDFQNFSPRVINFQPLHNLNFLIFINQLNHLKFSTFINSINSTLNLKINFFGEKFFW
jgi:hypothetical protein